MGLGAKGVVGDLKPLLLELGFGFFAFGRRGRSVEKSLDTWAKHARRGWVGQANFSAFERC